MYYFASDIHLGLDAKTISRDREKRFVEWLDAISVDAKAVFLVGDIFDFWFEYKRVIPKGFTLILNKISEMSASGIEIHFLCGNHDMWCRDYFEQQCGMIVHRKAIETELSGKKLHIEHGHMVNRGNIITSMMNKMFSSKCLKAIFSAVFHPNLIMWFGQGWSNKSRKAKSIRFVFMEEAEPLTKQARKILENKHIDYFVFGHLHCEVDYKLNENSRLFVLGEWIEGTDYARLDDNGQMTLLKF